MKSSTYAVLIGVYLLLIGPVILLRPEEALNLARSFTDQRILLLVGIPFAMISVLVLVQPSSSQGWTQWVLRLVAVLTILKIVVFLLWPNSFNWTLELVEKLPLNFYRCEGLAVIPLGTWLTWWGARTMRLSKRSGNED